MGTDRDTVRRLLQDSGTVEYYTPLAIVDAARVTLGGIDLDPASSPEANRTVRAAKFYTVADDGLAQPWAGRVWMNHPFSKGWRACTATCQRKTCAKRGYHVPVDVPGNQQWIERLVRAYVEGDVVQAVCICFAATSERWYAPLHAYPQVYLAPRTNYRDASGRIVEGVTKGSAVTYFGPNPARFFEAFRGLGFPKLPVTLADPVREPWRTLV